MNIEPLPLPGAYRVCSQPYRDERGWFTRLTCESEFAAASLPTRFVQSSASFNKRRHTLRGLHWQREPFAEDKLVRCTRGMIFDVLVDIRPNSATFGQWYGEVLTPDSPVQLFIPKGFAHGFLTLCDESEMTYQMTEVYSPSHACGIRYDDPTFAIDWPAEPEVISEKDLNLPHWGATNSFDASFWQNDSNLSVPSTEQGGRG